MTQLGLALKETGLDTVSETDKRWIDSMRASAIRLSNLKGMVSTDDLREIVDKSGFHPKHPNSYGAIFRGPKWQIVGRTPSSVPSNHHREIRQWRYIP